MNINFDDYISNLNYHLSEYSYVEGFSPSQSDILLHNLLDSRLHTLESLPHVFRWYYHIKSFSPNERSSFPHHIKGFEHFRNFLYHSSNMPPVESEMGSEDWKKQSDYICRNLQEVLGKDRLDEILKQGKSVKIYWGTATTGKPHVGYFVPLLKIRDFLRAGCEVTILLADLHAYLDNQKAPWDLLDQRTKYYEEIIKGILLENGLGLQGLKFVRGTDYQLSKQYTLDVYRISNLITEHDAKKAGAEVVKQVEYPLLSGLLYPGLQALDEEYLKVDAQFGGVDQRKIFVLAEKYLPQLGYAKRIHLMNPMVPGLTGDKMSSSVEDSKIDLLDSPSDVKRKLKKAFCEPGNVENNGVLAFVKHVLLPYLQEDGRGFEVEYEKEEARPADVFNNYEDVETRFKSLDLHPLDLKNAVGKYINELLVPVRKHFEKPELKELILKAYPSASSKKSASTGKKNEAAPVLPYRLDLRVCRVSSVQVHTERSDMYVVELDAGDRGANIVAVCAFAKHISVDKLLNRLVIALVNLKPSKIHNVSSSAIVLNVISDDKETIDLLDPPVDSKPGDRIVVQEYETEEPDEELNPKKKIWPALKVFFKTNSNRELFWKESPVVSALSKGKVTCKTLSNAEIQ